MRKNAAVLPLETSQPTRIRRALTFSKSVRKVFQARSSPAPQHGSKESCREDDGSSIRLTNFPEPGGHFPLRNVDEPWTRRPRPASEPSAWPRLWDGPGVLGRGMRTAARSTLFCKGSSEEPSPAPISAEPFTGGAKNDGSRSPLRLPPYFCPVTRVRTRRES
jgi:hypothetical protein